MITIVPLNSLKNDVPFEIEEDMLKFNETTQIQVEGKKYLAVGLGDKALTQDNIRFIGGKIRRDVKQDVSIDFAQFITAIPSVSEADIVTAFAEGWELGGYTFLTYKKKKDNPQVELKFNNDKYQAYVNAGKMRAAAVNVARDLCNEPANKLTPAIYAEKVTELFYDTKVSVEIIETAELNERGFHATATVGEGSKYPPHVAVLSLNNADTKHIALIGKGITFDSGGTNVKTASDIGEMKMDMGGSAAVIGAMKLLADSDAKVHVTAIIPMATNVAGKDAFLPSDVITYRNGMTVEVGNTDAEGRLVLADGILHAQELGADIMIDIATLTGTIGQALGLKTAGIFSNKEDNLWSYKAIGDQVGDHIWPMPVTEDYQMYIDSNTADINNMSTSPFGGAITAALFLKNFVDEDRTWVHIDMANTVRPFKQEGYHVTGAAGFGVRLLAEIVTYHQEG